MLPHKSSSFQRAGATILNLAHTNLINKSFISICESEKSQQIIKTFDQQILDKASCRLYSVTKRDDSILRAGEMFQIQGRPPRTGGTMKFRMPTFLMDCTRLHSSTALDRISFHLFRLFQYRSSKSVSDLFCFPPVNRPCKILKKNIFSINSDRASILARSSIPDEPDQGDPNGF